MAWSPINENRPSCDHCVPRHGKLHYFGLSALQTGKALYIFAPAKKAGVLTGQN
jgi:hypothetical protein